MREQPAVPGFFCSDVSSAQEQRNQFGTKALTINPGSFGDTPVSRCQFYRRVCGLPAYVDRPELGRIIMKTAGVWGLIMPAPLGQLVKANLGHHLQACGPIVSHPRSARWTFLIRPDVSKGMELFPELFAAGIHIADDGVIALPSPADRGGLFQVWVKAPADTFRQSGLRLLDAVRECSGHGPRPHRAVETDA
ncbi:DNA-directed RNA polymerase subunit beta [Nocardia arthritidis]|uniref:DNA-directed RNA polymerase subunit beta n=1 Tax=Nocardia arthritidis TaxID=228602 RepID=A0A6G9YTE8_9NOCA|nr:DNA-directed RNA polymerase subunit beta [Nocardia arthritidis]QIS16482.1 DNA-directed RNA polymerase subunit beta [Nocardia arthritidis]